jgi:hypothetical protein
MIPKRRTRPRMMAIKEDAPIRCQSHLQWVRGFSCVCVEIDPTGCEGKIQACHVRRGTDGGIGSKPGDNWTFPACAGHHALQHNIGEQSFEQRFKLKLKEIASRLWRLSPHRITWERKQMEMNPSSASETASPAVSTERASDPVQQHTKRVSASFPNSKDPR